SVAGAQARTDCALNFLRGAPPGSLPISGPLYRPGTAKKLRQDMHLAQHSLRETFVRLTIFTLQQQNAFVDPKI
ncbi:MAG TPA: hypothetical protein PLD73_11130, partial [Candidatus Hydrogenedentes bacterium]|nr:hypothetical protein [Candidatus Hydrogenedentota bacterium]